MVLCLWFMVYGEWFIVLSFGLRVSGLWFMVYGLWFMVYGLWFIVYEGSGSGVWVATLQTSWSWHPSMTRPPPD